MHKFIHEVDHHALITRALSDYGNEALSSSIRHRAIALALLAYVGGRSNEALRLTDKSIDIRKDQINLFIDASKNGKDRWISLPMLQFATHAKSLRESLSKKSTTLTGLIGSGALSVENGYELCRLYFNRIQTELWGEKRYTMHCLRHTLAILALKQSKDVIYVQTLLGHRSIKATMVYLEAYRASLVLNDVHTLIRQPA